MNVPWKHDIQNAILTVTHCIKLQYPRNGSWHPNAVSSYAWLCSQMEGPLVTLSSVVSLPFCISFSFYLSQPSFSVPFSVLIRPLFLASLLPLPLAFPLIGPRLPPNDDRFDLKAVAALQIGCEPVNKVLHILFALL